MRERIASFSRFIQVYLIFLPLNFLWHKCLYVLILAFQFRHKHTHVIVSKQWRQKRLITYCDDAADMRKISSFTYSFCYVCTRCCKATIKPLDKFWVVILFLSLFFLPSSFTTTFFFVRSFSVSIWARLRLSTRECHNSTRARRYIYMRSK